MGKVRSRSLAVLFAAAATLVHCLQLASSEPVVPAAHRVLIRGNLVTEESVQQNAWLDIVDGRIVHITSERPDVPGVPALETSDFIFPGFIDLHNHPIFNVFPRWTPPHTFANRYAWRDWDVYRSELEDRERALTAAGTDFCDIDEYVEVRALIGGTTSMIGFAGPAGGKVFPDCIKGLVRNLDVFTGFYGTEQGHERIANSVGILPRDMDANAAAQIAQRIANGSLDLLAIHIAEGLPSDAESAQELDMLDAHGLLTAHTALIHAVGLSPAQLARVHRAGASMVWSPRSNFVLYGKTANVAAAFREGVTISLAPDWAPSGSANMFDEIKYASIVSGDQLDGLFSARQLVEMASSVPARVAHIDDKVGRIAPGMLADFFLVHNEGTALPANPFTAFVGGKLTNIELVVVNGVPLYGDAALLKQLKVKTEAISICGADRALNADALPAGSFAQVSARLSEKMKAVGSSLAPVAECGP